MFCGKCGKEIEDDALTCKYCRASTEEVLDDQPTIGLDEMIAHQEARKASEKKEEFQAKYSRKDRRCLCQRHRLEVLHRQVCRMGSS